MKKNLWCKLKETEFSVLEIPKFRELEEAAKGNPDGLIQIRTTYNPEVFVAVPSGWTIKEEQIEYFMEAPALASKVTSKASNEAPESILSITPELTSSKSYNTLLEAPIETVKDTTEEPFKMSSSMLTKYCTMSHRTHYVKLTLKDSNLSFRFFFESEDNKHQEGSWWLKDHKNKTSIQVDKEFIKKHYEDIVSMHEIIGRYFPKRGYTKIVKNLVNGSLEELQE